MGKSGPGEGQAPQHHSRRAAKGRPGGAKVMVGKDQEREKFRLLAIQLLPSYGNHPWKLPKQQQFPAKCINWPTVSSSCSFQRAAWGSALL